MASRPVVAVVRTAPERVLDDIRTLCESAGLKRAFDPAAATILKENISWHFPFPGANTTPWQLDGAIRALRGLGYGELVCVGNNTVVTDPFKGERLNRLRGVLERHGVPVRYNFRPEDIRWSVYTPRRPLRVLHRVYPEGIRIPDFFHGKNILHLPTMKTHIYTTTTGAMKNAFGGLLNTRRHYTHSVIHETLVDLLSIQQEIHAGIFALMDGTIAGCGPGPRTMTPVRTDLMLASADSVAIDAVAARIMGFDPMSIPYLRLAHEAGLGVARPEEIEVVGEDVRGLDLKFSVGDNLASRGGDLFWFSPLKAMQRLLFHTPLVYAFIGASYVYHDLYWWPARGKRIAARIRQNDPWGKLFESYPE